MFDILANDDSGCLVSGRSNMRECIDDIYSNMDFGIRVYYSVRSVWSWRDMVELQIKTKSVKVRFYDITVIRIVYVQKREQILKSDLIPTDILICI